MAYTTLKDFAPGLDTRKSPLLSPPGTLMACANAFVNAGGEIERSKKMHLYGSLPDYFSAPSTTVKTYGLAFGGTNLVVFGDVTSGLVTPMPPNVVYTKITPASLNVARVVVKSLFNGNWFLSIEMSDGTPRHFYNGAEISTAEAAAFVHKSHAGKVFSGYFRTLKFSAIGTPTTFTSGTGSGSINISGYDAVGADIITGLDEYYGQLAVFTQDGVQLWNMDPDPALSTLIQAIPGANLLAPNAKARFNGGDLLFLASTGIRSLRARNSSNAAGVNDIGSPVDALVAQTRTLLSSANFKHMCAATDPLTGQFWMAIGSTIFVLSSYPNSRVSAWSTLKAPGVVQDLTVAGSRIAFRVGKDIYLYGDPGASANPFLPEAALPADANNYSNVYPAVITTAYVDAGTPATTKRWNGLDVVCTGEWDVYVTPDTSANAIAYASAPEAGSPWVKVASISGTTYLRGRIPLEFESTHMAVSLRSTGTTKGTISSLTLHHDGGEAS